MIAPEYSKVTVVESDTVDNHSTNKQSLVMRTEDNDEEGLRLFRRAVDNGYYEVNEYLVALEIAQHLLSLGYHIKYYARN